MDIQKIYLRQAELFLNSSLFVLLPASIFIFSIIVFIPSRNLMFLVIPFFIYSLFLFQNYLMNYNRFISLSNKITATDLPDLLSCQQILLYFDKDAREILFLHPTGQFLGKIIESQHHFTIYKGSHMHPREFVLVDSSENVLASYLKSNTIDVHRVNQGYFGGFSNGVFTMLTGKVIGSLSSGKIFFDEKIINGQGEIVFRVRKGWMPIKVQQIFLNPNTPHVTFNPVLSDSEKLLFLSLLINRYYK
jgi:hypothetical protein